MTGKKQYADRWFASNPTKQEVHNGHSFNPYHGNPAVPPAVLAQMGFGQKTRPLPGWSTAYEFVFL
ncbi:hypothetical protein FACS189491_02130 [Spirochaetia bacterium]|nr:hypothetical protein FACS189491_02130 [Spirochaetia bacterium]